MSQSKNHHKAGLLRKLIEMSQHQLQKAKLIEKYDEAPSAPEINIKTLGLDNSITPMHEKLMRSTFDFQSDDSNGAKLRLSSHDETPVGEVFHHEDDVVLIQGLWQERYQYNGHLGSGGVGQVRSVYDQLLNRDVALKSLHHRLARDAEAVEVFIHEAQLVSQLQHPRILSVYDIGLLKSGEPFFTMEVVKGCSLKTFMDQLHHKVKQASQGEEGRPYHPDDDRTLFRLVDMFRDICKAVAFAHQHKVIHRDLKPSNIMVDEDDEVLVVDWGLAQVTSQDQEGHTQISTLLSGEEGKHNSLINSSLCGTPGYMAPELTMKEMRPQYAHDIFALGSIFFEMLNGVPLVSADRVYERFKKGMRGEFQDFIVVESDGEEGTEATYLSHSGFAIPTELVNICYAMIKVDPEQRVSSVRELTDVIGQWLDGTQQRKAALEALAQAEQLDDQIALLEREQGEVQSQVSMLENTLDLLSSENQKRVLWEVEDQVDALKREQALISERQLQGLRSALVHKSDLMAAHAALAIRYQRRHQIAEMEGDDREQMIAELNMREHLNEVASPHPLQIRLERYLEGTGSINIQTDPPHARLTLQPYQLDHRRLKLGDERWKKEAPLEQVVIEQGSYLLTVQSEGYHTVNYPISIERCEHYVNQNPEGSKEALQLLPLGELGPDDCYVPASWCWLGGDPHTPNSLPKQRVWIDGFVIRKYSVTHEEYLKFINSLVHTGLSDDAHLHVPREQSSSKDELGQAVYHLSEQGDYTLPVSQSPEYGRQPVTMIQWQSALAYAQWLSQQDGKPWRLPTEFEWEKAARGVDGRFYPWGDYHDPTWSCMKDSHDGPVKIVTVDEFPVDESVYGVRGTAGNTRDWCLDKYRDEGPLLENGRLIMPTEEELQDEGFKSTRGGSYGNSASRARSADRDWWFPTRSYVGRGFRLAWGLNDRSGKY